MAYNLHTVRKLDVETMDSDTVAFLTEKERFNPAHPWIDNDRARNVELTDLLIPSTTGYGVADEQGRVLATFDTLVEADRARDTAKIEFSVTVKSANKALTTIQV